MRLEWRNWLVIFVLNLGKVRLVREIIFRIRKGKENRGKKWNYRINRLGINNKFHQFWIKKMILNHIQNILNLCLRE